MVPINKAYESPHRGGIVRMGLCSDMFSRPVINVSSACSPGGRPEIKLWELEAIDDDLHIEHVLRSNMGGKERFHPLFNRSCRNLKKSLV